MIIFAPISVDQENKEQQEFSKYGLVEMLGLHSH